LDQDNHLNEFRGQIQFYNEMLFAFSCHSSGFLNVIFQQRNTVFVVIESKQSDGNLFVAIAKIFERNAFIYRDFEFDHSVRRFKLSMNDVFPVVEAAIRKAIEVEKVAVGGGQSNQKVPILEEGFVLKEEIEKR
jgi:hypothetical protein